MEPVRGLWQNLNPHANHATSSMVMIPFLSTLRRLVVPRFFASCPLSSAQAQAPCEGSPLDHLPAYVKHLAFTLGKSGMEAGQGFGLFLMELGDGQKKLETETFSDHPFFCLQSFCPKNNPCP
jgi:hypothetical protein